MNEYIEDINQSTRLTRMIIKRILALVKSRRYGSCINPRSNVCYILVICNKNIVLYLHCIICTKLFKAKTTKQQKITRNNFGYLIKIIKSIEMKFYIRNHPDFNLKKKPRILYFNYLTNLSLFSFNLSI